MMLAKRWAYAAPVAGILMFSAEIVILILKVAVIAVTVLLLASLVALYRGNYWLHGRINIVFFILTLSALVGLEVIVRLIDPDIFVIYFERTNAESALWIHLMFSLPSAAVLPFMLITGTRRMRKVHIAIGCLFLVLWTGTFITGVFFLPHHTP